ncbi:hypothetical protein K443DRAFT_124744 [Laccaria amethystina LaAM-08-1]|uniref:Unplaced genomic scaffold K443scaffold_210, whole genome shotgun sequence n=1 Tax=Laccaria amethystina LaAM-08-1 TaxID=1095629 RepID=A0A0C9XHU7_9AGAR|nr:hypothetical protein K443DRAFT_124744 [Laccaria amethystina LaAM-08-1]
MMDEGEDEEDEEEVPPVCTKRKKEAGKLKPPSDMNIANHDDRDYPGSRPPAPINKNNNTNSNAHGNNWRTLPAFVHMPPPQPPQPSSPKRPQELDDDGYGGTTLSKVPWFTGAHHLGPPHPARNLTVTSTSLAHSMPTGGLTQKHTEADNFQKYPNLNPILAADTTLLRFDIKKKPRTEILVSTYLLQPQFTRPRHACHERPPDLFWTIDIDSQDNITCEVVWDALYPALQGLIVDSEWGFIIRVVDDGGKGDKHYKRIDFLGDETIFGGLEKDDELEKAMVLPLS